MFRYTNTIIFFIFLFSCGQPTTEKISKDVEITENSYILSVTDSLLNVADGQIENIRHVSKEKEGKIIQLESKVQSDISQINGLTETLNYFTSVVDSLNNVIDNKDTEIYTLSERLKIVDFLYNRSNQDVKEKDKLLKKKYLEFVKLRSDIDSLNDSIVNLNDSIDNIMESINHNLKPNKLEKILSE